MFFSQKSEYQKPLLTKCIIWHKLAIGYAYCVFPKTQPSVPASMRNLFLNTSYMNLEGVNILHLTHYR